MIRNLYGLVRILRDCSLIPHSCVCLAKVWRDEFQMLESFEVTMTELFFCQKEDYALPQMLIDTDGLKAKFLPVSAASNWIADENAGLAAWMESLEAEAQWLAGCVFVQGINALSGCEQLITVSAETQDGVLTRSHHTGISLCQWEASHCSFSFLTFEFVYRVLLKGGVVRGKMFSVGRWHESLTDVTFVSV